MQLAEHINKIGYCINSCSQLKKEKMSKRKYNVELLNDEDEEDAQKQFSGLNIFKKTKAASNQVIIEKDEKEQTLLDLSSKSSNNK